MGAKKPTSLKEAKRTLRTSRTNDEEPIPDDDEIVPPSSLSKKAKKVWEKEVPRLRAMGILGNPDINALELYCETFAEWKDITKKLQREGMIVYETRERVTKRTGTKTQFKVPKVNPLFDVSQKLHEKVLKLMLQFGMTPVARTNVKAKKPKETEKKGFNDLENC